MICCLLGHNIFETEMEFECYKSGNRFEFFIQIWNAISDESCAEADPTGLSCIRHYLFSDCFYQLILNIKHTLTRQTGLTKIYKKCLIVKHILNFWSSDPNHYQCLHCLYSFKGYPDVNISNYVIFSVGTAYNYSTTPAMLLMSSEDTVIR